MQIKHIFGFKRLGDGGSLIVSFQSTDSCKYWLAFPKINRGNNPAYGKPVLINRSTQIQFPLSLKTVKSWLITLEPYLKNRKELPHVTKESEYSVLEEMLALCESEIICYENTGS